ncbi:MAG: Lrp/AsnC family transcriptional regulator [Terracidiphilus sp.]|jgi:DNA-binding Lrp family transcriptional regulator
MRTKRDRNLPLTHKAGDRRRDSGLQGQNVTSFDDLDGAILRFLELNGRATNYEVGEAAGLSASAASRRILALEDAGAIRGYRALIDDRVLGKRMTVFIRITLERQSAPVLTAFEAAVRRSKAIVSCHLMAGQYDYMLVVRVADMDDYGRLHQNELSRLPGVTRLETSFALRDVLEV